MKIYFLSLIAAALVAALVGILTPNGDSGGIGRHVRFILSLFLLILIVSPLTELLPTLEALIGNELDIPQVEEEARTEYREQMEESLQNASKTYAAQTLIKILETEFSIPTGEVRCAMTWEISGEQLSPTHVTVILSGSAIWKNPRTIEQFVTTLLHCECTTAIE